MDKNNLKENRCPICENNYSFEDPRIRYHVGYKPEITIDACRGCNYAEYLIRNPQVETDYYMDKRKEVVRQWTVEKRSLIS